MTGTEESILRIRGVSKSFSGVEVLHGVDLDLAPASVHAIVGENGAGKSTLIKILSGVHRRDGGDIFVDGKPVDTLTPRLAQGLGIVTHLLKKWNTPKAMRIMIAVTAVISLATPMGIIVAAALPLIGVTEIWIHYRKPKGVGA